MRRLRDLSDLIRVRHRQRHNKPQRLKLRKLQMLQVHRKMSVEGLKLARVHFQVLVSQGNLALTYSISFSTTTSGKNSTYTNLIFNFREQQ
jgi:hypothetical protein